MGVSYRRADSRDIAYASFPFRSAFRRRSENLSHHAPAESNPISSAPENRSCGSASRGNQLFCTSLLFTLQAQSRRARTLGLLPAGSATCSGTSSEHRVTNWVVLLAPPSPGFRLQLRRRGRETSALPSNWLVYARSRVFSRAIYPWTEKIGRSRLLNCADAQRGRDVGCESRRPNNGKALGRTPLWFASSRRPRQVS